MLVIPGSGGGFDQGELLVRAVLGDGFRWLAPSRFGYLRSTVPAGASFDEPATLRTVIGKHILDQAGKPPNGSRTVPTPLVSSASWAGCTVRRVSDYLVRVSPLASRSGFLGVPGTSTSTSTG